MISCPREYTITIASAPVLDMPLDQAVFVPASGGRPDTIVGVRSGFLYQFDATGTTLLASARVMSGFGPSTIVYVPGVDKLYVSPGYGDQVYDSTFGEAGTYCVDPTTLTVTVRSIISDPNLGVIRYYVTDMVYDVVSNLIFVLKAPSGMIFLNNNYNPGFLVALDPTTNTISGDYSPWTSYTAWNRLTVCSDVVCGTDSLYGWIYTAPTGALASNGHIAISGLGLAITTVGTNVFFIQQDGVTKVLSVGSCASDGSGLSYYQSGFADNDIETPHNIRYSAVTGLLYIPLWGSDRIGVMDPNNPATAMTYLTGYDYPFDIVSTTTNVFAVQQGSQGLKLIA